jgi:hypothetical protein
MSFPPLSGLLPLLVLGASGLFAGCFGSDRSADVADARSPPKAGEPVVRGCSARAEGGRATPQHGRDTLIGPLAFVALSEEYNLAAEPDPQRSPPPGDFNAHPLKALILLRAGVRATLVVPRAQRQWMQLLYDPSSIWRGSFRVTLQACRQRRSKAAQRAECRWKPYGACRWRNTQFNGTIYVDFDRAPERGRCAQLIVRTKGRTKPLMGDLFNPSEPCEAPGG